MTPNRTRLKNRYTPLATRLFILFIVAAVLPLGVSGIFGLTSNYSTQRRQVEALQQEIAANTANAIDAYLEQIEAEMALTAGKWTLKTEESVPMLLQALLTFDHGFEILTLVDKTGQEAVKVNLKSMWDVIAQVEIGTGGYAYVVDGEGQLIAHRDSSQVLQGQNLSQLTGVRHALLGQTDTSWYAGLEGADVIGSYQPLRRAGWFVLVESPRREALANVYQTGMLNIAALAATLSLAALLGGYMARSVVRPVRRLQEGAALIGRGDLAHRIDIPSRDEIGDLAEAFNGMAARLWQTLKGLEQHVTELKRTETALRESEARYRRITELISDYAYSYRVEPDGSFTMEWITAESARRMTGYDPLKEVGSSLLLYHPDDQAKVAQDLQHTLSGQPTSADYRIITKQGELRWLHIERHPIWDAQQNRMIRFLGVAQDITRRKQIEEDRERLIAELEAKNAELERFTYTVSHDLKSPLVTITGFLGFFEQDAVKGDMKRLHGDIQRIREATNTMQQLLNELLELSRIGRLINPLQDVAFGELVQEALTRVAGQIAARQVQVSIAPDLPNICGDHPRLVEVI